MDEIFKLLKVKKAVDQEVYILWNYSSKMKKKLRH